jgi:hypothetical protein
MMIWKRFRKSQAEYYEDYAFEEAIPAGHQSDIILSLRFDVRWQHADPQSTLHHEPEAVIRTYLRAQAESEISRESPTRHMAIQDRINARLGLPQVITSFNIRLIWASVRISIDEAIYALAVERERRAYQALLRAKEQEEQIKSIECFRDRIASNPGTALAYWFWQNPDKVGSVPNKAVMDLAENIARYVPESSWVKIAQIIHDFVNDLTADERRDSIQALVAWFRRYDKESYLEQLPRDLQDAFGNVEQRGRATSSESR